MISKIISRFTAFKTDYYKLGFTAALKLLARKTKQESAKLAGISKPAPVKFYEFIYDSPFGAETNSQAHTQFINWVIPDFNIGSGGHLNIFRVVKKLEERGIDCRIVIDGGTTFPSAEAARNCIRENFFAIDAEVSIGRDSLQPAMATFATSWTTAYTVRNFRGAGKRYYFVQDFEPLFYATGSDYCFAEATYKFGFKGITAGDWLAEKLRHEYDMETVPFKFSYDQELYIPTDKIEKERKRVFFYARSVTPRRAFELGLLSLALVHRLEPSIEFVLAGWDTSSYSIPFPHLNAGVLSLQELPQLYSQCDVALVLSLTNLSLLPLEIMACNCTVVSNRGDNVEWMLNESSVEFTELTPEAIAQSIVSLFKDTDKLDRLRIKGRQFAESTSWEVEVDKIAHEIKKDLNL